jgi:hypothetical protein
LQLAPQFRSPLDDHLWDFYRSSPRQREGLEKFVSTPLVRTLLALGPKAQVRFYQTANQTHENNNDRVAQCYAVTYEEQGEKKSFFVVVEMVRRKLSNGQAGWQVVDAQGGVRPEGW